MAVGYGIGMGDDAGIGTADRGWRLADRKYCVWTDRRRDRHRRRCWSWRGRRRRDTAVGDDSGEVVGDGSSTVVGDGIGMGDDAGIGTAVRGWRLAD